MAQIRYYFFTLGPKVGIIYIRGSLGNGKVSIIPGSVFWDLRFGKLSARLAPTFSQTSKQPYIPIIAYTLFAGTLN